MHGCDWSSLLGSHVANRWEEWTCLAGRNSRSTAPRPMASSAHATGNDPDANSIVQLVYHSACCTTRPAGELAPYRTPSPLPHLYACTTPAISSPLHSYLLSMLEKSGLGRA